MGQSPICDFACQESLAKPAVRPPAIIGRIRPPPTPPPPHSGGHHRRWRATGGKLLLLRCSC